MLFVRWVTAPERAAQRSIDTSYVTRRSNARETALMKQHVTRLPQAVVARDLLKYAVPELSTRQNQPSDVAAEPCAAGGADGTEPAQGGIGRGTGQRGARPVVRPADAVAAPGAHTP